MTMHVAGIGTALPEHHLTQTDAVELHARFCRIDDARARTLRALYRRSGIEARRSVLLTRCDGPLELRQSFYPPAAHEEDRGPATEARMRAYARHAPPLAQTAAARALERAGISGNEVTHLVTVSCTGFVSPGVDAALIEGLGLPRSVERTNVGFMGCHGALNGLRVAKSFVDGDAAAVPLVCAVELCTLHFAYGWDPEMLVANALFADGAAALVGRASGVATGPPAWRIAATGTLLMDGSAEAMTWRVGDHGFRMTLSAEVPVLIETHLRDWLQGWLAGQGLGLDDVASWAVHPGGPRILGAVERALGLTREETAPARAVLVECGNMSSPTILFILDRMHSAGAPAPCVALAFGPGLVVEATLFL
jgi:predicted naringenin-chalcone synthase